MHYKRCLDDKKYFNFFFIILGMVVVLNLSDYNTKRAIGACLAGSQKLSKTKITDLDEAKKFCEQEIRKNKD
jgi:hypothetical protein